MSLTFDDGRESAFRLGALTFQNVGLPTTQYITTKWVGEPGYVTWPEIRYMAAAGHEIGAHTRTHRDLSKLDLNSQWDEIHGSMADLQEHGIFARSFAYPGGRYDSSAVNIVRFSGFGTARSVRGGYNSPSELVLQLRCYTVDAGHNTTVDDVKRWVAQARKDHTWLILLFHRVDEGGNPLSVRHELLQQIADYLISVNANVVTATKGARLEGIPFAQP